MASTAGDQDPAQILAGVVKVLASADPGIWRGLLEDHRSDSSGCCTSCYIHGVGAAHWPCTLRAVAERAQQLASESPSPPSVDPVTVRVRLVTPHSRWDRRREGLTVAGPTIHPLLDGRAPNSPRANTRQEIPYS
jgi:hypothetical protein